MSNANIPTMDPMKNPYKGEISFTQLAKDDVDFAKFLKPNSQLDFTDPAAVLQLTKSLLKRDFNLTIDLPDDRLCPPVPNRLNYLLFIDALLRSSTPITIPPSSPTTSKSTQEETEVLAKPSSNTNNTTQTPRKVIGLDIGTGASAIYPLLGCRSDPTCSFLATDIDTKSLQYAQQNITVNNLQNRITLIETKQDGPLVPLPWSSDGNGEREGDRETVERLDFVMCNPPFYSSPEEMDRSAKSKNRPPNSTCTGSPNELICPGGEISFISLIISESLLLRDRVQWYTSMVGKLSSLIPLIERLKKEGCRNWVVSELVQGSKTRRWVLGWSWRHWRPGMEVARGVGAGALERRYLPFPSEYILAIDAADVKQVTIRLDDALRALKMTWTCDTDTASGMCFSEGDVWSRSARRKMKGAVGTEDKDAARNQETEMKFVARITVEEQDLKSQVTIRWLKGNDSVLFESFCGMIKRTVESAPKPKRKADDITN